MRCVNYGNTEDWLVKMLHEGSSPERRKSIIAVLIAICIVIIFYLFSFVANLLSHNTELVWFIIIVISVLTSLFMMKSPPRMIK